MPFPSLCTSHGPRVDRAGLQRPAGWPETGGSRHTRLPNTSPILGRGAIIASKRPGHQTSPQVRYEDGYFGDRKKITQLQLQLVPKMHPHFGMPPPISKWGDHGCFDLLQL